MAKVKARSRHGQGLIPLKTWGGRRENAGRPKQGLRASEKHKTRPALKPTEPVHVVVRVKPEIGTLRCRNLWLAIREATITAVRHERFRIVHASVQGTHVHLIVEAEGKLALARGMQGLQISAAKHINKALAVDGERRKGGVFVDRYHATQLRTPRAVRNCISYVLNNWRHHGDDRRPFARRWTIDPFSSAISFPGWKESDGFAWLFKAPSAYRALVVWLPRTWLLHRGWQRHGPISAFGVPG